MELNVFDNNLLGVMVTNLCTQNLEAQRKRDGSQINDIGRKN